MKLAVRSFVPGDAEALGEVFHRAVREGAAHRYSADQRAAWSPEPPRATLGGRGWQRLRRLWPTARMARLGS